MKKNKTNKRKIIGYGLTITSLILLVITYLIILFVHHHDVLRTFFGANLTIIPLFLLLPYTYDKVLKAFQILALLAPWHFFIGGLMILYGFIMGWWICFLATTLEIGAILHNFKKRKR